MTKRFTNFISNDTIQNIIDTLTSTQTTSIEVSDFPELKDQIQHTFGISTSSIPIKWVTGDTPSHIDTSTHSFIHTHLIYLTDSPGVLRINSDEFPITKGAAFLFDNQATHSIIGTNSIPRLLIGPMSEYGLSVGAGQTIVADGATDTVYLSQVSGNWFYRINTNAATSISSFPVFIQNINASPSANVLKLLFSTDVTLSSTNEYFICGSDGIQFGNTSLNPDGSRPRISVPFDYYDGLIQNGTNFTDGYNSIYIYNLILDGTGYYNQTSAGWIGKQYFGKNATNNYIVNCTALGDIHGGGIIGYYAGNVCIIGCSSEGYLSQPNAGGIVGGYTNGTITIESCWTSGAIMNDYCGGIIGGNTIGTITIINCYTSGAIFGNYAGGICGSNVGINGELTITNCYTSGAINGQYCGGISGSITLSGSENTSISISNCYTLGFINGTQNSGGIYGLSINLGGGILSLLITNCYTCGTTTSSKGYIIGGSNTLPPSCYAEAYYSSSGWSTVHANTVLLSPPTSEPGVSSNWVSIGVNQEYLLRNMGYTPYSTTVITTSSIPSLIRTSSFTVASGNATSAGRTSTYQLLQLSGGIPSAYSTITINPTTGVISTTSRTTPGTYTVYVYTLGSYHITTVTLTVVPNIPCLIHDTKVLTPEGYVPVHRLKKGDFVVTSDKRRVKIVNILETTVIGCENTYPCIIRKGSIHKGYPAETFSISQDHLIQTPDKGWILPKTHFPLDRSRRTLRYVHIQLKNYNTDHLVISGGTVVESLAVYKEDKIEYYKRILSRERTPPYASLRYALI